MVPAMSTSSMLRSLRRTRNLTYRAARVQADGVAVLAGKVPQRVGRRYLGRGFGRLVRSVLP